MRRARTRLLLPALIGSIGLLTLPGPSGGTARASAIPARLSIGDVTISEGTTAARAANFAVTLDHPSTTPVTVQYQVVAGTATAGVDVDTAGGRVRTLTFAVGRSGVTPVTKTVAVKVLPDAVDEPDETFSVQLVNPVGATLARSTGVGTIVDDDPIANGFRAAVDDVSIVEGDQGARTVSFTVALSQPAPNTVSVDYVVQPLSASAGSDVVVPTAPKHLTFTRGASGLTPVAKTVNVTVVPDTASEGDETFALVLQNPSVGMLLADATGIGRIIDDDAPRRPLAGTAVKWPTLGQPGNYATIAGRRFDIITPENEMKWDATEPQRGVFTFATADAIVDFARAHGETVHGHALAWYSQNPAWLTSGTFTRDELIAILTNHITTVMQHFGSKVSVWDVVNEPIGDDAQLRPTIWSQGIGPDYLDIAFRAARAAVPTAKLYVNEYNTENPGPKADALYAVVAGMVARGVPIDGVGFQTHTAPGWVSAAGLGGEFARYAALGLDVAVTELDVRIPVPASAGDLAAQATTYAAVRDACVAAANCVALTTWGFTDAYSWVPSFFPGYGAALPWDAAYAPKPAYTSLAPLLRN